MNDFMKLNLDFLKITTPVFLEIRGRDLLHAEGYCRIEGYSQEKILLASQEGTVAVYGENLNLVHLTSERIAIKGRIKGIDFI